jgi:hypothetical protein
MRSFDVSGIQEKKNAVIPAKAGIHLDLRGGLTDTQQSEAKPKSKWIPA